jgi:hypothetical protein
VSVEENNVIDAITTEQILDKLIHYYFHFMINDEKHAKSHFYSGYLELTSAMAKLGHPQDHFKETKTIAAEKKNIADQLFKGIMIRKDETPGLLSFRDISRQYDQFRTEHTPYGEQVNPILSGLVKHWNVQFY